MDLKIIILSAVSQTKTNKYHNISSICGIQKNHINEFIYKTENRLTDIKYKSMVTRGDSGVVRRGEDNRV